MQKLKNQRLKNQRLNNVQKSLSKWGVEALIVTNPVDLFYLTGIEMTSGTIIVTKKEGYLIVDGRYFEKCSKVTSLNVVLQAQGVLKKLLTKNSRLGFAQEQTNFATYLRVKEESGCELVALQLPMEEIRAIKEAKEIQQLQKAANLLIKGFDFLSARVRKGVTEKALAKELELFWITAGADRLAFDPIIAFGKNGSMPHYRASNVALEPHDAILVDIGVVLDGYASDMTRMLFFGKPQEKISDIYDIVLQAQTKAIKQIKPKQNCAKLYEIAHKVIDQAGYGKAFMHGLGHGIGLDVHEFPTLRATAKDVYLQEGMCVTVEPGIYLPNVGGVRIEDMVLVTKEGHKIITNCPKTKVILPL